MGILSIKYVCLGNISHKHDHGDHQKIHPFTPQMSQFVNSACVKIVPFMFMYKHDPFLNCVFCILGVARAKGIMH